MRTMVIIFVNVLQFYLLIGVLVAIAVQFKGLQKIDSGVKGSETWFRVITFPGMVALWPVLISKWIKARKY